MRNYFILSFALIFPTFSAYSQDLLTMKQNGLSEQANQIFQGMNETPFRAIDGIPISDALPKYMSKQSQEVSSTFWTDLQGFSYSQTPKDFTENYRPKIIEEGTIFRAPYLAQSNFPQSFTSTIGFGKSDPIILDEIFVSPNQPVDLFEIYNADGSFWGLLEKPENISAAAIRRDQLAINHTVKPRLTQKGGKIFSSLSHLLNTIAYEICTMKPRPQTLVLEVEAGVDFFASFSGSAQVTLDLDAHCNS